MNRAREPWEEVAQAEQDYIAKRVALIASDAEPQLRLALASPRGVGMALRILVDAPSELVMDLADALFVAATATHPQVGLARRVLGRLDPGWLDSALSPWIDERLSRPGADWVDYRRIAELLSALRLRRLLKSLVERAAQSADDDVQEVAADFSRSTDDDQLET